MKDVTNNIWHFNLRNSFLWFHFCFFIQKYCFLNHWVISVYHPSSRMIVF